MEELQKLYDVLVREGKYTKSFDEFKVKWSQDEAYKNKVYDVVSRDGIYTKDKNSFFQKYSATPSQQTTEAPVVKKKFALDSSSEVGSSVSQKFPEVTKEGFKQAMKKQASVPTDMSGKPIFNPEAEKVAKPIVQKIQKENQQLASEKKKYEDIFDKQLNIKPKVEESKYLKDRLSSVNTELINREEEYVVPELQYQFGDLGFKFEESGATGDYVKVTAPNGKTTEISLDNFLSSKSKTQSELLQNFIKNNTPAKGLFVLEKTIREQDKKFNSQKQVDDSIKAISNEVNNLNARQKQFLAKKSKFEKELQLLGPNPDKNTLDLLEKQRISLNEEMKSILQEEENVKQKGKKLDASVGKYSIAKAKQGTWLGGIWNAINEGASSIAAGTTSLTVDLATEIAPAGFGMSPKDLKDISVDIAKKIGVSGPTANQTIEQWKSTLTEDQLDNWEDEVDDYIKKDLKGKVIPAIRIGNREIYGDPETTKQWSNLKEKDFWGGAILGLSKSLPAMVGGAGPAGWAQRTSQMYAQVSDGLAQEMEQDPDFKDISENEKLAITLPIGIVGAVLEEVGLKNIKGSQGLLNGITLRVLGKAGKGTTAKTFRELVENEVDGMMSKGLLTITAAGAAEFETGAAQELADTGFKALYNEIKDKEMFNTPNSTADLIENVVVAGAQEAVGGFVLGVPTAVSTAFTEKGFLKMDDNTFETFTNMANDDKMQSAYITNLKEKITSGTITSSEAKDKLNNYRNSVGLFRQMPEGLNIQQQKEAMNLLKEKRDLDNFVNGKDPALVVKQKNRINEINDSLTKLTETDAVQEQSTTEIPVQSETGVSETLAEGISEPKPEVVTEQVTKEEVDSKINEFTGKDIFYHGTTKDFEKFEKKIKSGVESEPTEQPIFLAENIDAATPFSGSKGGRLLEVKIKSNANIFNPENITTDGEPLQFDLSNANQNIVKLIDDIDDGKVELTLGKLKDKSGFEIVNDYISYGDFDVIESKGIKNWLIDNDFDGSYIREFRGTKDRNIAIFNTDLLSINKPEVVTEQVTQEEVTAPQTIIEEQAPVEEVITQELNEQDLPGYDRAMSEVEGIIQKSKQRGQSNANIADNVMGYVMGSKIYEDATDVQREALVRDVRKMFGLREKSAPSVAKLFGTIKDIKKVTINERDGLIKQIKDRAKGARDVIVAQKEVAKDLAKEVKELSSSGKITVAQAANIVSKFSKVNLLNEVSVSSFVDYMSKVFSDAEYDNKINVAKNKIRAAKKNIVTKLGLADGLVLPLQRLFSINPELIPDQSLDRYLELLNMFSARQQVLTLDEKSEVSKDVQDILDEINNEQSLSDELADRFEASESKVYKDDVLDYAASIKKMLDNGEIDSKEAELMTKYKNRIVEKEQKAKMTEEEIEAEKKILIKEIKKSPINAQDLPTRDEKDLANRFSKLLKSNAINELTNVELKNILKLIDNINKGYLPHYTQLMVEKMNSINNAKTLESAVEKSKLPKLSSLYAKAKSLLTKKDYVLEMIRRNPLFYIDQVLGDFKTKDVFNSVLEKAAEGEANFTADFKKVKEKLNKAQNNVAKSFALNANKTLKSSFKMMTYAVQLEYDSNKGNKEVNPASEYLKATIKHISDGKSQFGDNDAKILQEIYDEYVDADGNIDNKKLYNSFNKAEKDAIKTIREVNESLTEKAEYTSSIIRGQKINPLTNYIHLNVLHEHKPNDLASGASFANDYNNSMRPSTKAKSLIERTGKVSPLNFDIFSSAERGAKFVLMDYNLTEPIRTARKTINRAISDLEKDGKMSKENRRVINGINKAVEESVENLVLNSYTSTSIGDDVVDYISKQGYRSVLAGTGRFASEFLSNVGFILISDPNTFTEGVKYTKTIMSPDAPNIMQNVNSKETNRIFPSDMLSGRLIDTSILSQATGVKGAKSKNSIINKLEQVWNLTGKKYKNAVELSADFLISTPDKIIMRPIWFGSFATQFENTTGEKVDFKKIADNDAEYMEKNKEAIDIAKNIADERSVITGASSNAFSGILKGSSRPDQSATIKAFNNFNNFMTRFLIYEYVTARTGIYAAMGNGSLTRRQGVALLGAVTTRMTVYSLLIKALGGGIIGLLFDDEEDEEKSIDKQVSQALASTFSSLLLGRDFGNATKTLINYGVERVNENYFDFLREGDYDPYKDAIQYTTIPSEKKGKQTDVSDLVLKMGGSFGPALNTTDLILKKSFEPEKQKEEAIERTEKEKNVRIPLEVLGNLGYVPLYKDIRKSVLKDIYKGLEQANEEAKEKAEERAAEKEKLGSYKNKTEMKKKNPALYEKTFKDETKKKSSFGSSKFGSSTKSSKSSFGAKKFGGN